MAPGGETYRLYERFGENVLRHGSHEWLPYSKNAVCTKPSNTNLSIRMKQDWGRKKTPAGLGPAGVGMGMVRPGFCFRRR